MLIDRGKIKSRESFKVQKGSILEKGYGQIPKLVMQDSRLSIEAKAIYSYLCSYAGGGSEAFPSVAKILSDLKISENRFYKHFKYLITCGYIRKYQGIDSEKKFQNNVYEIVQIIDKPFT